MPIAFHLAPLLKKIFALLVVLVFVSDFAGARDSALSAVQHHLQRACEAVVDSYVTSLTEQQRKTSRS